MTTPQDWFDRACGSWTSQRRYLFAPGLKPSEMVTSFTITPNEPLSYCVEWEGVTKGTMILSLNPEQTVLERSRDYFDEGGDGHDSQITMLDDDTLLLNTKYSGQRFREEIRMLEGDQYRLRQTVGFSVETGKLTLVGQYWETRI